jgi:DNA repair exonuclease SbcCD ATPase subunit
MDEEIWRAYLDSLTEKELRSNARRIGFKIDGFRKDHQKTPKQVLVNHLGKYPGAAIILPGLIWLRGKIEQETEFEIEQIEEKQEQLFTKFGEVPVIAALVSSEDEELMELGELWFDRWLEKTKQQREDAEKLRKQGEKLESKLEKLQAQIDQLEKKVKRVEKGEKEWKNKYESLKEKNKKAQERLKKKTDSCESKIAKNEEEISQWMDKYKQLEAQLAKVEKEKERLEQELNQSCLEVLVIGTQERHEKRKRIGSELVNLTYIDYQKQNTLSELIQDKDYILLHSVGLPNKLRTDLYTNCLKAGKHPLEVTGEEELDKKLLRVLGAGR